MKRLIRAITALLVIFTVLLGIAAPVYAITDPDSPPSINAVYVYQSLLEAGDRGVLIDYLIDYTSTGGAPPTGETVTEAYLAVFIAADGVTQLKSVAPYTFQSSGYGRGLVWIYFTAAEATAFGLTSASVALYRIWLTGNPTLAWAGDPPKTIAGIDQWNTTGDPAVLLALRVLFYADLLELAWTPPLNLIEATPLGNKLTTTGESYFDNAIPGLRVMAPSVYASGEFAPIQENLDYSTAFGATMTNGTGTVAGSPITLVPGAQDVDVTVAGTFTLVLTKGTIGTVENNTGVVTGSPVDLVYGTNTITVPGGGIGLLTVTVNLDDTQSKLASSVIGTGFDLTDVATRFGMSRWMFSGLVWLIISIIICAAVYRISDSGGGVVGSGKMLMIVFDICIIGGAVLGLMHPLVAVLFFIGWSALIGYVLFFRGANI